MSTSELDPSHKMGTGKAERAEIKSRLHVLAREIELTESSIYAASKRILQEQHKFLSAPNDRADVDELSEFIHSQSAELEHMYEHVAKLQERRAYLLEGER